MFVNFIQPSKSIEFSIINKNINNRNTQLTRFGLFNVENPLNSYNNLLGKNLSNNIDYVEFLKKKKDSLLVAKAENQNELIIQSDKQSEISDVIYAEQSSGRYFF